MSKSRRTAREANDNASRRKGIFRSPDGGLRGGWLLAVSLLCYTLVALGLRFALAAGFGRLFYVWGVDATTTFLAPKWAQMLYRWHGAIGKAITALALVALSVGLRWAWQKQDSRKEAFPLRGMWRAAPDEGPPPSSLRAALWFALLGHALALAALLLGLIPDSLRPDWPLTAPRFTLALVALCAFTLLSILAEELFTKRVLYDGVKARWGVGWAVGIACAAVFLVGGGWAANVVGVVNGLLMALLACAVYASCGIWAAVGLRFGWSVATVFLLGFGGGEASVYRFYGVSEALLTGGDAGPACGLWTTILLTASLLWLKRERAKDVIKRIRRK